MAWHAVAVHTRPDEDACPVVNEADSHTEEEEAAEDVHNNDHNTDQQLLQHNTLHDAVHLLHQDEQRHDENEEVGPMNASQQQWHHVDDDTVRTKELFIRRNMWRSWIIIV